MKFNKKIFLILLPFLIVGCSFGEHSDLKEWMTKQEKELKGKIEKLPPVKVYEPTQFSANTDPFSRIAKVSTLDIFKNKYAPDFNRPKEELEQFDLSTLRMVGTVQKDNNIYAMIKDSNKNLYYVKKGNYMGLNYGKVISLNEGEIILEERFKDYDKWEKRETKIFLFEGMDKR